MIVASPVFAGSAGCEGEDYRAFDFWLGRWNVHLADGKLAGHNEIRVEEAGGRVRQFFEESREPGVWKPWFEGFYAASDGSD